MNQENIKIILEAAIKAPSGENCQPWKFKIQGDKILLFNQPEKDLSLYNWNQSASYIAHGAALENMSIAAAHYKYELRHTLFPDPLNLNLVASITLDRKESTNEIFLFNSIKRRVSNRKVYQSEPLSSEVQQELMKTTNNTDGIRLVLNTADKDIKKLGQVASIGERIVLENKSLHSFFFEHINWTKEEDDDKRTGFYVKTLELPEKDEKGFRMASNWRLLSMLNLLGISKKVAEKNAQVYSSCGAMGIFTILDCSPKNFVQVGRLLERLWLKATELNVHVGLMTGVLFLKLRIDNDPNHGLSKKHVTLVEEYSSQLKNIFHINHGEKPVILFRLGYGEQPSAQSSRLPLEYFIET